MKDIMISIPEEILVEVDSARGRKNRTQWIRELICERLQIDFDCSRQYCAKGPTTIPVNEIPLETIRDWRPGLVPLFEYLRQGFSFSETAARLKFKKVPCPSMTTFGQPKVWSAPVVNMWTKLAWKEHCLRVLRDVKASTQSLELEEI